MLLLFPLVFSCDISIMKGDCRLLLLSLFMIIMDYLQDEHNRYYILKCFPSLQSSEVQLVHSLHLTGCFMQSEVQW